MGKLLVTGGAGFIGSNLVDELIAQGHDVVVVDNLLTGKKENLNPLAQFYELDIRNLKDLEFVFSETKPEFVFHLAAGYLVQSLENPQRDAEINIIGTINLIALCLKHQVKKIIYSNSGGASYGEPEKIPITEDHPIHPLTPYGASKYAGEMYLYMYHKTHGLDYVALRYANIYGPRQDPKLEGGVISIFIDAILNDKPLKIFGDGRQTRDYCYVGDVVKANITAMSKCAPGGHHVATSIETSVVNLLDKIKKIMEKEISPEFKPPRVGDCQRAVFDISKIEETLGWKPSISLEEGIRKTLEWQRGK